MIVHTLSFAIGVVQRDEENPSVTAGRVVPWMKHFGLSSPDAKSDPEPLTKSIAAAPVDTLGGYSEAFAPERHAPAAERAVRTLKGLSCSQIMHLKDGGICVPEGEDASEILDLIMSYAAHCHNRFQISAGSTIPPIQKVRGQRISPQLTYPFRAIVYAKVSKTTKQEVQAKYARGAYLGPLLGSVGHRVHVLLDNGELRMIVAPGLKFLYPLRFESRFLPGCTTVEGFVPPRDGDFRELHLPYIPGGGPPVASVSMFNRRSESILVQKKAQCALGTVNRGYRPIA